MTHKAFTLTDPNGQSVKLPVVEGSAGTSGIDVRQLQSQLGVFSYDPAFKATCSCHSDITYIDGAQGLLTYRGYPVEELSDNSNFLETSYLLLHGQLPKKHEYEDFIQSITEHSLLDRALVKFFDGFHQNAHPMAMLTGIVGSLSAFYHDTMDIHNPEHRDMFARRIIAKMPTIVAAIYKQTIGQPKIYPRNELDYTSNLLRMMFSVPTSDYEVDPIAAKALDILFILHADHEQNASTTTVRVAGSTGTNPYAAISSGIAALWGPAHGGANEAVLRMLNEIGDISQVPKYIEKAKDKDDPFKLMGFGHRVYKNFDPRALIIRGYCHQILEHFGMQNNRLFELALELERIALEDDYFKERKLYPNVDFYSGIIYQALGIPSNMFTPMFATARTVGWVSHWMEMMADPQMKIFRPRQIYNGSTKRDYVDIEKR